MIVMMTPITVATVLTNASINIAVLYVNISITPPPPGGIAASAPVMTLSDPKGHIYCNINIIESILIDVLH